MDYLTEYIKIIGKTPNLWDEHDIFGYIELSKMRHGQDLEIEKLKINTTV